MLKQDSHVPRHRIRASRCCGGAPSSRAGSRELGQVSTLGTAPCRPPTASTIFGNSCVWQAKTHSGLLRSITWQTILGNFTTEIKDTWSQCRSFHSMHILLLWSVIATPLTNIFKRNQQSCWEKKKIPLTHSNDWLPSCPTTISYGPLMSHSKCRSLVHIYTLPLRRTRKEQRKWIADFTHGSYMELLHVIKSEVTDCDLDQTWLFSFFS